MQYSKAQGENSLQFPMTQEQIDTMKPCALHQPNFLIGDPRVFVTKEFLDENKYDDSEFESELVATAFAVSEARKGADISKPAYCPEFMEQGNYVSRIFDKYKTSERVNARQLANLVHSDTPTQFMDDAIGYLLAGGAKLSDEVFGVVPYKRFTDGVVFLHHLAGRAVHSTSPSAFCAKYYYGRLRPEEAIALRAKGEIQVSEANDHILETLIDKASVLRNPASFTMYTEGCPNHPSYPAMHSSLAAMLLVLAVVMDITPEQYNELRKFAVNIAFGRTYAGVHYPSDNIFGLKLGEHVIAQILPDFLDTVGADREVVLARIAQYRTDW